jgi:hypothetical protein
LEKYLAEEEKNDTFRTIYNEKSHDAFRVYCFAGLLKKTNTSPVKDTTWFNAETVLNKFNVSPSSRLNKFGIKSSLVPTYHAIKMPDEWR